MVRADFSQLACRKDPKDVIRLVVTRGDDIWATQAVQLKWNDDEVMHYLGATYPVPVFPVFVMGRIAANPEIKERGGFRALLHLSLKTMIEIGEKTPDGICALNVHAAGNKLIPTLQKLGWETVGIERDKGVFDGPQALTFLLSMKAIRHSLDLLNASKTVPNYRFKGASLANALLSYQR
jgi:hypothetical protein